MTSATRQEGAVLDTRAQNTLAQSAAVELRRTLGLLRLISDEDYCAMNKSRGSVGAHVRHNLDVVVCLLNGIDEGRVDYTERERDERVETDRDYAALRIDTAAGDLLNACDCETVEMLVRSEIHREVWLPSTLERELEFVHSHTVHHYALIVEKLAAKGIALEAGFGVAPSTLSYWDRIGQSGNKATAVAPADEESYENG